jgi:hypothetical protein
MLFLVVEGIRFVQPPHVKADLCTNADGYERDTHPRSVLRIEELH